ncbi:glycosyltransferase family 4 protein [Nostocaceae cyanobacterium CENA369]|uniref:Glycosyltransferase family 4 protein n=1 Tax=Dendronalium phyllosphericum CENA369 TaxID=1725256 RepID=A0A8J7HWY9_9NOST|nr:glycosyltransferase family 4 protein [Dendronalium phyllosphericum]MBH8571665.1 glycosyltransferase family 4 protein [Dendronalium phyllosphericum CENA369]
MNTVPKTIWHVGGEDIRFRIPLLLALRDRGFNVGAVGSENGDAFAKYQIPYFQYTLEREINPLADIQARTQIFNLFSKYKPDVVHGFDTKPAMITPIIGMKAKIPGRVRTINGMGYIFSSNSPLALTLRPIYRHLQKQASAAAGITVFQNIDDRAYFRKHQMVKDGCDDLVLGSGIDIEQLIKNRPNPEQLAVVRQELGLEGQLVVTMIARLVVAKGVREYLDAARIVCQKMPNVKFILIGPFSSEGRQAIPIKEVQQQAEFVSYLGVRNDITTLLSLSDIFVLPSYREGMSRVLLEAGAMQLPLITTNTPGCKDIVRDGWNGLLVPPRNAKALATAILQLLKSPDQRILMGTRSEMHVRENFSLQKVADSYTNIYYRVLGLSHSEQLQLNKSRSEVNYL